MTKDMKQMIEEAPEKCLITGLLKIKSYVFDEGVVYGTEIPLDAYTLPTYNHDSMDFSRVKIDMDNDFRREDEILCELSEILDHTNLNKIIKHYSIPATDIIKAYQERLKNDDPTAEEIGQAVMWGIKSGIGWKEVPRGVYGMLRVDEYDIENLLDIYRDRI